MQYISTPSTLPELPMQMHPLVGTGLIAQDLIFTNHKYTSPEQAMAEWRGLHSAERAPFRCLFSMEPQGKTGESAVICFLLDFEGRQKWIVGKTANDPDAAKILIANWRAGHWMTHIRWELYEDKACENLIDIGRFDQWDLLLGIDKPKLESLAEHGIAPRGNWDFDHLLWAKQCTVCGKDVSVNSYIYNIDSVVCAECGNRPFLAPDVHQSLEVFERKGEREMTERGIMHVLSWMSSVNAKFDQVRLNAADANGERLCQLWNLTPMAKVLEAGGDEMLRPLVEKTGFSFEMYKFCSEKMRKALTGEERFGEEHRIAIDFVIKATELLRIRQLTTNAGE